MPFGVVTTITGADASASPAPALERYNNGFPTAGLIGLYLLQDGTVGSPMPGSLTNSVSGGPSAAFVAGGTAFTRRSFGMDVTLSTTSMYDTGLGITPNFTAIVGARMTNATGSNWGIPALFRRPTSSNGKIQVELDNSAADGQWQWFHGSMSPIFIGLSGSNARLPSVTALRFDGTTGTSTLRDHTSRLAVNTTAGMVGAFNGLSENWRFGFQPGTTPSGEFYVCAVYNTALTDARMTDAIAAAKTIMTGRGLTMAP